MNIAMIGHKQFPSRSGGVEVVVYELATRLAKHGENITVYNRGKEKNHNKYKELGVNIIRTFTFEKQSLNAMVYSFTATFHALFRKYDIIHYHAIGPCVPLFLPHFLGKKTVATVHGLNWRVDKWKGFASRYIKLGERTAAKYADEIITLSEEMHRYFLDTYGRDTTLIKNAISPIPKTDVKIINEKFGLKKGEYILYVGRISPEKGVHELIEAYNKTNMPQKLVIAGEMPDNLFAGEIKTLIGNNPNIICTGFASGDVLNSLYSNCGLYVLPSHTEGLPLTLLEAMSCGGNCLVSDIVENTSVLNGFGADFKMSDIDDLAKKLEIYIEDTHSEEEKERQIQYICSDYGYDRVIDEHLKLYHRVLGK